MSIALVHLSDFHFKAGTPEGHALVLDELIRDIASQLEKLTDYTCYLVFSGDLVQAGDDEVAYQELFISLDERLRDIGICKERRIIVPGNHDVSRKRISEVFEEHEGLIRLVTGEEKFNNVVRRENPLTTKFPGYVKFAKNFASNHVGEACLGSGFDLSDNVGVFCLNTALASSGGLHFDGVPIEDEGRLGIDTRGLYEWSQKHGSQLNILVMHHPMSSLASWAQTELRALIGKTFGLVLCGHTHTQTAGKTLSTFGDHVQCIAPPLYTHKDGDLGYSIIKISGPTVQSVAYRQWTKGRKFVAGTSFSGNDSGEFIFGELKATIAVHTAAIKAKDQTAAYLDALLRESLRSFNSLPIVFVEPTLRKKPEASRYRDSEAPEEVSLHKVVAGSAPTVIHAGELFGLTCLARRLAQLAWADTGKFWAYIDFDHVKPNRNAIGESISSQLKEAGVGADKLGAVIIDSLRYAEKDARRLISKVMEYYPDIRVICMQTDDGQPVFSSVGDQTSELETYFLWSMDRIGVRRVVTEFLDSKQLLSDEDSLTSKVVADIEAMNIHRTPFNCLTLLKASELDLDDNPVNRTELIKRVLFLLFNVDHIPKYKSRPDLKDCEYVLGGFAELMLREGFQRFSRDKFLAMLGECAKDRLIDIDVGVVFDVLMQNRILIQVGTEFEFRFSYWVFYFAAQRMHHSAEFASYVLSNKQYAKYPEVMEFYTGTDRHRDDAISIMTSDLASAREAIVKRLDLPHGNLIFEIARWAPSEDVIKQMTDEAVRGVESSNLPASVKDKYADRHYDRSRPYSQDVRRIFEERSYYEMLQTMKAASQALRNSDYVGPELKRKLLGEILLSWEFVSSVIMYLMPALVEDGEADFEGIRYLLDGDFGERIHDRLLNILVEIPRNVSTYYQDDIYSQKMAPLLFDAFKKGAGSLGLHLLTLILIRKRPRGWRVVVDEYIAAMNKNSFYLSDVYRALRGQYQYSYASKQALKDIEFLILKAAAKHTTGAKDPGLKQVENMKKTLKTGSAGESVVPTRASELTDKAEE